MEIVFLLEHDVDWSAIQNPATTVTSIWWCSFRPKTIEIVGSGIAVL